MVHKGDLVAIGISVGLALGILIASLVFFIVRWYKRRAHLRRCANERSLTTVPIRINGLDTSTDFSASLANEATLQGTENPQQTSQLSWWGNHSKDQLASASGIPRYFYKDVQKATQNFTTILGQGSFGPVYKATMPTGEVVAVKALASNSKQGEKEFQTEVTLLGRLHHRNLVNLLGYCVDKGQRMLIYEFMSNGSLANLLYDKADRVLSWEQRLQIALDISHGIEYLHEGAVPPVIHRDLKSANILLDRSMRAKVADFGLSKEEVFDERNSGLKGTYGYIDPAYISTNSFTKKSDVYSFGVIIFELITAIHPHQNLMEYVNLASMSPDGVDEILDERLAGECNVEEVRELAKIAHKCLHKLQRRRPSIVEVSQAIVKIRQRRRLTKEDTMSFARDDLLRLASHIEDQRLEMIEMGKEGD
ncbi:leucine-rich repeat receptor-like serine/threonine-protein kinase [Tripterygium wilfordii]|uniref:Leucine-rich repeat receptor-like serine/threonine-protein kinase n=1 Tax=Tripterygium wilfordii TaxID=458696 RepID=A0A7J7CP02_TRIWF|nr:calcium/calmodulin-regulated receptor-like kinase 2 [Tripterygium wilfordii]XP_038725390.1 calcium/calmodulin-regulated receptor-like kinase 2 [Tripterygium wilfordii]KAF5735636.1 leucine-rich repeat receptor-like serine/threonine-protein kinase [Tripterygium wilfordii]